MQMKNHDKIGRLAEYFVAEDHDGPQLVARSKAGRWWGRDARLRWWFVAPGDAKLLEDLRRELNHRSNLKLEAYEEPNLAA